MEIIKERVQKTTVAQFLKIEFPKYKDYANLKCGYDKFSKLSFEQLIVILPTLDKPLDLDKMFANNIKEKKQIVSVIRWVLRGLNVDQAIQKNKIDQEISNRSKRKKEDEEDIIDKAKEELRTKGYNQ